MPKRVSVPSVSSMRSVLLSTSRERGHVHPTREPTALCTHLPFTLLCLRRAHSVPGWCWAWSAAGAECQRARWGVCTGQLFRNRIQRGLHSIPALPQSRSPSSPRASPKGFQSHLTSLCGCFLVCKMVRVGPAPWIEGVNVKQVFGTQWGSWCLCHP